MGKKKDFSKTIACLSIFYMLSNNIGDGSSAFLKEALNIDSRYLLYNYIKEINAFFSESKVIIGYQIPFEIKYDHYLKKYVLLNDEEEFKKNLKK